MNELVTRKYSTNRLTNEKPKHLMNVQSISSDFFYDHGLYSPFRVTDLQAHGHHLQFEIEQQNQSNNLFIAGWSVLGECVCVEFDQYQRDELRHEVIVYLLDGCSPDARTKVAGRKCKWDLTRLFYSVMDLNLKALIRDVQEKTEEPHKISEVKFNLVPQPPMIIRKYIGSPRDRALNPSIPFSTIISLSTKTVARMNFSDLTSLNKNSENVRFRILSGLDSSDPIFQIVKELDS